MRVIGSLMLLSLLVLAGSVPADAAKKKPGGDSETACVNWCFDHNSSTPARDKCLNQCECYYHGNLCSKSQGAAAAGAAPHRPLGNQ